MQEDVFKTSSAKWLPFSRGGDVLKLCIFPWWRHQMETFSALLASCAGNSPVPVNFPHKGQWRAALMFALICVWINAWINNRKAGDLRRYCAHYDVIVMRRICCTDRCICVSSSPLRWRHSERNGVSNHQPHDCLLNRLVGRRSKKSSKLRVTGLCAGNSPATGEFPAQIASTAENVSIWWGHHATKIISW